MAIIIEEVPEIKKEVNDLEKVELVDNSIDIDVTTNFGVAIKLEAGSV